MNHWQGRVILNGEVYSHVQMSAEIIVSYI